jgi:hypothetical protein
MTRTAPGSFGTAQKFTALDSVVAGPRHLKHLFEDYRPTKSGKGIPPCRQPGIMPCEHQTYTEIRWVTKHIPKLPSAVLPREEPFEVVEHSRFVVSSGALEHTHRWHVVRPGAQKDRGDHRLPVHTLKDTPRVQHQNWLPVGGKCPPEPL